LETFPTPTIIRVRGELAVFVDSALAADAVFAVSMGLMVLPTATITIPPSPLGDIGSDWFWWDTTTVRGTTGLELDTASVSRIKVDGKAMRKVGLNETVVFVAAMNNCEGTGQANVCGNLRFLLKAP